MNRPMTEPTFSIVIPLKELNDYVDETVSAILDQSDESWEVLIVTNDREASRWPHEPRVRLLESGRVGPAEKRDIASRVAQGTYLVFLDDDSYPRADHLRIARRTLVEYGVDAVGGPAITPESDGFFQQVSGASFLSRLTGGAPDRYRPIGDVRFVDDWPSVNFVVKRTVFDSIGGFNSPYWPGEDTFLCWKLVQAHVPILYQPELVVWHHRRAGLSRHLKQVSAYGLHRGYFMRMYPETSRRLKYVAPAVLAVSNLLALSLFVFGIIRDQWIFLSVLAHVALVAIGALGIIRDVGVRVAIASIPFVFLSHYAYGLNVLRGVMRRKPLVSKLR